MLYPRPCGMSEELIISQTKNKLSFEGLFFIDLCMKCFTVLLQRSTIVLYVQKRTPDSYFGSILMIVLIIGYFLFFGSDSTVRLFLLRFEKSNSEKINQEISSEEIKPDAIKVPIFVFHSVNPHYPKETKYQNDFDATPGLLENLLKYLGDNGFTSVSFDDLVYHFEKEKALPAKPYILAFDDGWKDQYIYALPILKKYHDSATFFIFTNAVGHDSFMTWSDIRDLDRAGMCIGGHTKSHPYLSKITDKNLLREEIVGGKEIIEKELGKPITVFAYPFGHYTDEIISIVKEAGFRSARTTYKGRYHTKEDLFTLKSILVSNISPDFSRLVQ